LVYEAAVPVSFARHGNWSVEVGADYAFSRKVNSVPLMAVEMPIAASEYAVVFGGTGDVVMPAVILGLRSDENLYVGKDGSWQAKYIPAFLRRYPFVFSSRDEGKTFTLCIDEGFPGFNQEGRGQPLFDEEKKPTPYVDNVLKFLQQYQLEFNRTQAFCKKLKDLNLLEPMQAQISLDSGEKMMLTGFSAVDRGRLKTLSAEALAELAKSDELELIYNHLLSMRNFSAMRERVGGAKAVPPPETPDVSAAADPVDEDADASGNGKGSAPAAEKKKKH
jgi:hypothetical protein